MLVQTLLQRFQIVFYRLVVAFLLMATEVMIMVMVGALLSHKLASRISYVSVKLLHRVTGCCVDTTSINASIVLASIIGRTLGPTAIFYADFIVRLLLRHRDIFFLAVSVRNRSSHSATAIYALIAKAGRVAVIAIVALGAGRLAENVVLVVDVQRVVDLFKMRNKIKIKQMLSLG